MALVSATGANLSTLLDLSAARPDLVEVALVASDRERAGALDVARAAGVPTWPGSVETECGRWRDCVSDEEREAYRLRVRDFHDRLCGRVEAFEREHGEIDLVVLAYHRWIHGAFLEKFAGRMVNQHPGDLADLDAEGRRTLVGMDPVGVALRRGDAATRTSTFFVDDTHDGGAIIVRGPEVPYRGPRPPLPEHVVAHELEQKTASDRPALVWAVTAIAQGRVAVDPARRHADGSAVVLVDGRPTPLGGYDLAAATPAAPVVLAPRAAAAAADDETDVPVELAGALTVCEPKAEAYRRDPHFRAGAAAVLNAGTSDAVTARALVVLKPDALAGRRVGTVLDTLRQGGFAVVGVDTFRFTPLLTRELWRFQFNIATRDRVDVVDLLLPAGPSLAVLLEDTTWRPGAVPASCRLGDLKGPADPGLRRPEHLRSRLAAPTTLFNFVHTADEPADVLREAALVDTACGTALLGQAVAPRPAPPVADADVEAVTRRLYDEVPAHDLDAVLSARRLLAREPFRGVPAGPDGTPHWRDLLARCGGRPSSGDIWDLLSVATDQIESNVPGLVPLLPTVRSADWRRARGVNDVVA